jgi:hypothetical protein
VLAIALLVAAFARPFFEKRSAAIATTGAREVVILLDRSASMGYADRWSKARDQAKKTVNGMSAGDHATVVLFASDAAVASEPMAPPDRVICRDQRGQAELRRHQVRARAQDRVANHRGVDAPAARSGHHLRFPEDRVDDAQRIAFPQGHDRNAGGRRRSVAGCRRLASEPRSRQHR